MKYDSGKAHGFLFDDQGILVDVNSGLVHAVTPEVIAFITEWEKGRGDLESLTAQETGLPEEVHQEIMEVLVSLIKAQMLMSEAPELEAFHMPMDYVVKALCLHVAHDCNLRCRYCFAGTGDFGGQRGLMDYETGKKALDFLFDASKDRRHIEVDYFGGEPLMNFEVVKALIIYGREESLRRGKILKQTLTTNGMLLEGDILDFLNREEVALVLSLDGRREVHDAMRPTANDKGSYEHILPRLQRAVASRNHDNYYLRGTFTHHNLDFFEDVKSMLEAGFDLLSQEPVVAPAEMPYAFKQEDLPTIYEQYEKLARFYVSRHQEGKPFLFFHFNLDLNQGPCLIKRLSGCGAGHEYLAVSPDGVLYPCHQFVGEADFVMGDVNKGVTRPQIGQQLRQTHVLTKETCRSCWARFYCSGGCHANAWHYNQDLSQPYEMACNLEKKRLECALWIQARLQP